MMLFNGCMTPFCSKFLLKFVFIFMYLYIYSFFRSRRWLFWTPCERDPRVLSVFQTKVMKFLSIKRPVVNTIEVHLQLIPKTSKLFWPSFLFVFDALHCYGYINFPLAPSLEDFANWYHDLRSPSQTSVRSFGVSLLSELAVHFQSLLRLWSWESQQLGCPWGLEGLPGRMSRVGQLVSVIGWWKVTLSCDHRAKGHLNPWLVGEKWWWSQFY